MIWLTRKQAECIKFIGAYIEKNGCAPAIREIAEGIGVKSISSVHALLRRLEERGYIRRIPKRGRAIEVVEPNEGAIKLSPHVERAVAEYARRTNTTPQVAANELLAEYLGKAAA